MATKSKSKRVSAFSANVTTARLGMLKASLNASTAFRAVVALVAPLALHTDTKARDKALNELRDLHHIGALMAFLRDKRPNGVDPAAIADDARCEGLARIIYTERSDFKANDPKKPRRTKAEQDALAAAKTRWSRVRKEAGVPSTQGAGGGPRGTRARTDGAAPAPVIVQGLDVFATPTQKTAPLAKTGAEFVDMARHIAATLGLTLTKSKLRKHLPLVQFADQVKALADALVAPEA